MANRFFFLVTFFQLGLCSFHIFPPLSVQSALNIVFVVGTHVVCISVRPEALSELKLKDQFTLPVFYHCSLKIAVSWNKTAAWNIP